MLTSNKRVTLEGRSVVDGNEIVRFIANIPTGADTRASFDTYINDQEAYRTNLKQVWKDEDEFRAIVREQEETAYATATEEDSEEKAE